MKPVPPPKGPQIHPDTKEMMRLVAFIVFGFFVGLFFLVTIIVFFMKYD